jgi:hypothetical protein
MNVGALIDDKAPAFRYAKHLAYRAVHGAGLIVDGVPQFIPLH